MYTVPGDYNYFSYFLSVVAVALNVSVKLDLCIYYCFRSEPVGAQKENLDSMHLAVNERLLPYQYLDTLSCAFS